MMRFRCTTDPPDRTTKCGGESSRPEISFDLSTFPVFDFGTEREGGGGAIATQLTFTSPLPVVPNFEEGKYY